MCHLLGELCFSFPTWLRPVPALALSGTFLVPRIGSPFTALVYGADSVFVTGAFAPFFLGVGEHFQNRTFVTKFCTCLTAVATTK